MFIKVLDKSVYELIAAGEVIERPSSVVKELVENSIDAGSGSISVEIRNGGRTFIRVSDNGSGIQPEDIPTAFERHATSKINTKEDLDSIATLGFRGEALASICAVSKVELLTKCRGSSYGVKFLIDGGECMDYEECGCPDGTVFTVRDLFYNVPARLKFLKKDVSEGNAVENMVSKIALSHPEIAFKFIRDGKNIFVTPGDGRLSSAVYSVLGREFAGSLLPVDYTLSGVSVSGFVTKPLSAKSNRSFQNFFVNSRFVKSVTCMVALEEAYRNQIMVGKFPGCVLKIDISPASTDVNVHPAKLEIRFSEEKPVYDAIYFAVKNALMIYDTPDNGGMINDAVHTPKPVLTRAEIFAKPEEPVKQFSFGSSAAREVTVGGKNYNDISPKIIGTAEPVHAKDQPKSSFTFSKVSEKEDFSDYAPALKPSNDIEAFDPATPDIMVAGEIFRTYIVATRGDEMYLIDKHAAHERLNFNNLKKGIATVDAQQLLNPFTVKLSYDGHTAVCDNIPLLERFGFTFEPLDHPDIRLTGVPILLTDDDPADILAQVADNLAAGKVNGADEIFDELFHSVACKASIKGNQVNGIEELERLAKAVFDEDIRYCPHGRPTTVKFTKYELEKLFKRVQ